MADAPLIDPKLFSAQAATDVMLAWFRRARQVLGTRALVTLLVGDEMIPGPKVQTD